MTAPSRFGREQLTALGTMLLTLPVGFSLGAGPWALLYALVTGTGPRDEISYPQALVFAGGLVLFSVLGIFAGAVAWARLMRGRVSTEVAWDWFTRGAPPLRAVRRFNAWLFRLGYGSSPDAA